MTLAVAVMVLAITAQDIVIKVARVFRDEGEADKYIASINQAIKSGLRKDVLAVWKQTNVRLY